MNIESKYLIQLIIKILDMFGDVNLLKTFFNYVLKNYTITVLQFADN